MADLMKINGTEIFVKEYAGQRVLTLREIDKIHGRKPGSAENNYRANRKQFVAGTDFFLVHLTDREIKGQFGVSDRAHVVLAFTLFGYLMLVKSFTDDLAWKVQRELVNCYFNGKVATVEKPQEDSTDYFNFTGSAEAMRVIDTMFDYSDAVKTICHYLKGISRPKAEEQQAYSIVLFALAGEIAFQAFNLRTVKLIPNNDKVSKVLAEYDTFKQKAV